jgi:ABC-type phosphate transport system substrate-binding protein
MRIGSVRRQLVRVCSWLALVCSVWFSVLGLASYRAEAASETTSGAASTPGTDGTSAGPLRIVGSGYSMPVLMRPWIEAFEAETGVVVEVVPSGTSTGPPALVARRADVAAMTRPLREAEAEAISRTLGAPAIVLPVARDEVAVFVNEDNPIGRITLAQIDAI